MNNGWTASAQERRGRDVLVDGGRRFAGTNGF